MVWAVFAPVAGAHEPLGAEPHPFSGVFTCQKFEISKSGYSGSFDGQSFKSHSNDYFEIISWRFKRFLALKFSKN